MWMIVLFMMVLTRTRSVDDSPVPITQSLPDGSASTIMPHPNRRRRRNSTNTRATTTEQPVGTEQVDIEQSVNPPKRRGPSLNRSVTRTSENLPEGSKIPLIMDKYTIAFFGTSATDFATECAIIIRNFCPMNYQKRDSVPEDAKALMYEKLEGKFTLLRTDAVFMEYVNSRLHAQWKRTRCIWSQHWKQNGGKTNPQLARTKRKSDCRSQEWNHLCDYWELEKTKVC
ncbi:hypothetical protein HanPI659440_Chr11g0421441 [Helianthus annuus]|nr:hypothetical protein HanPI659440_Chr11g0421441 [Helianthus annuus]